MNTICPVCGQTTVTAQDIEGIGNAILLVKLQDRVQLCCEVCGWMGFDPEPFNCLQCA